jgi:beta-carotene/zeaxanthin 4-ketolase
LKARDRQGLRLAAGILLLWVGSLFTVLLVSPTAQAFPFLIAALLLRTQLHTGLFIVAHDAMHGLLLPQRPSWNHRLGALALGLYGALGYGNSRRNHLLHHRRQASASDPDFHTDPGAGPLRWYLRFMGGYLNPLQMTLLLGGWGAMAAGITVVQATAWPEALLRVLLGCTLPLLLSSVQLFVVGTYLPHRGQRHLRAAAEGPISLNWPGWLSLLACYHFGYHREHHEQPGLPWFQLPEAYRRNNGLALP